MSVDSIILRSKDTVVIGFHGHSHRSKKYWAKPYDFYPEHFLEPNGELRKNVEGFFPFSTGNTYHSTSKKSFKYIFYY